MVKMERGQFYLLLWIVATTALGIAGTDEGTTARVGLFIGVVLFAHYKYTTSQEEKRNRQNKQNPKRSDYN